VLTGACKMIGFEITKAGVDKVAHFLADRFTDHSQRLPEVLRKANEHAWTTLEVALEGESLWRIVDRADDKALRQQVRTFLDTTPLAGLPGHGTEFRQQCLRELRAAQGWPAARRRTRPGPARPAHRRFRSLHRLAPSAGPIAARWTFHLSPCRHARRGRQ
jgi:hypothetical protein